MTNATFGANAPAMPNRRTAFGAIAAAGAILAAPRIAHAATNDEDIFAAIEHVKQLRTAEDAAGDQLDALYEQCPTRADFPALLTTSADKALWETVSAPDQPLNRSDIEKMRRLFHILNTCGFKDNVSPTFGPARQRADEVWQAEQEFQAAHDAAFARLGIAQAKLASDRAYYARTEAAEALLEMRPKTCAGIRAIVSLLLPMKVFEEPENGIALSKLLLEAPALEGEG